MWCSTNPSVIRGCFWYALIIPWGENSVKKADSQLLAIFTRTPCAFWQECQNPMAVYENQGGSDNHPNIISIPYCAAEVNCLLHIMTVFFPLHKAKLLHLYNIPSCFSGRVWYYIATKRWFQWSLEKGSFHNREPNGYIPPYFFRSYIKFWTSKNQYRKWYNFCHREGIWI